MVPVLTVLPVCSTMVQKSLCRLIVEQNQKEGLLASVTSETIYESNISYPVRRPKNDDFDEKNRRRERRLRSWICTLNSRVLHNFAGESFSESNPCYCVQARFFDKESMIYSALFDNVFKAVNLF
jgi:hypothetical protein